MRYCGKLFLLSILLIAGCISSKHRPDKDALIDTPDCEIVVGNYAVESAGDGDVLARLLFSIDEAIANIEIQRAGSGVSFRGETAAGQEVEAFGSRSSCADSILRAVLVDEMSGSGIGMSASDRILEMYSSEEGSLNLRFIDTTIAFLLVIPYYSSGDELVVLREVKETASDRSERGD